MRGSQGAPRAAARSATAIRLTPPAPSNRRRAGRLSPDALSILEDWLLQHFHHPCAPSFLIPID